MKSLIGRANGRRLPRVRLMRCDQRFLKPAPIETAAGQNGQKSRVVSQAACLFYKCGDSSYSSGDTFSRRPPATAMNVQRPPIAARAAVRQLVQRNLSSAAAADSWKATMRFQQVEWRRAWTAEEQAQHKKHAVLQKALQKAHAKDMAFMAKVCEDLVAAAGTNWKLEMTTTAHEHRFGQEVAK